jgi:GntR family transcriptional regulator
MQRMTIEPETNPGGLRVAFREGMPRYLQLRNTLSEAIAAGRWKPGEQLPAEHELASMAAVSVGTVQRSLRMLVDEGRLVRRHGAGTFAADLATPLAAPFQHVRFLDEDTGRWLPIYSRVIRRRVEAGAGPWTEWLRGTTTLCLERVFTIGDEFKLYTHLYFEPGRLPELARVDPGNLNGVSIKDYLANQLHIYTSRYSQRLSVRLFPPAVCRAISVKNGTSGAVLELTAHDRAGEVIYFQDFFIPPNTRRLLVEA